MNMIRWQGLIVLAAALLAIPVLAGCPVTAGLETEATSVLTEARLRFNRSEYGPAAAKCGEYITAYPQSPVLAEAYYLRGLCRMYQRRPKEAAADLSQALPRAVDDGELQFKCRLALAHVAYEQSDYRKAAKLYEAVVEKADAALQPEILFRYGMSLNSTGQGAAGVTIFRRLLAEFPSSGAADRLRKRVSLPGGRSETPRKQGRFAVQIGAFGKQANARQAISKLADRGYPALSQQRRKNGRDLHAVLVGWYAVRAEAEAIRRQLLALFPGAILVERQ